MREDRRQQGVARTQLEHAENRFTASGCFARTAAVLQHNELGHAVWTALGYAPQQAWRRWIKRRHELARGKRVEVTTSRSSYGLPMATAQATAHKERLRPSGVRGVATADGHRAPERPAGRMA